jgi:hypothetical protein
VERGTPRAVEPFLASRVIVTERALSSAARSWQGRFDVYKAFEAGLEKRGDTVMLERLRMLKPSSRVLLVPP